MVSSAGVVAFHVGFLPRPDGGPQLPLQAGLVYCADKAYADKAQRERALALGSRLVSALPLPVESLFRWLMQLTGFQDAGNVRSEVGLERHW